MNELLEILNNLIESGTVGFVILTNIKTTIILSGACLMAALMHELTAAARNMMLRLALAAVLLLPILSFFIPSIYIAVTSPAASRALLVPFSYGSNSATGQGDISQMPFLPWQIWLVGAWLLGVLIVGGRSIIGYRLSRKIIKNGRPIENAALLALNREISKGLNINRQVRLVGSSMTTIPYAFGILNPTIVLPTGIQSWPPGALRMVLVHELAHIRRRDLLWLHISTLVMALHWFNPAAWVVRRKMIMESDKTCDDYVLSAGAEGALYAERLVMLARYLKRGPLVINHGTGMARQSQLEERIMSILNNKVKKTGMRKLSYAVLIAAALLLVVPMAAMQLRADEAGAPSLRQDSPKSEPERLATVDEIPPVDSVPAVTNMAQPDVPEIEPDQLPAIDEIPPAGSLPELKEIAQQSVPESEPEKLPAVDEFVPADSVAKMIKMAPPIYPDSAKKAGIEGAVYIRVSLDSKGKVRDARIAKSSGSEMLDKAALDAAHQCEWKPAVRSGRPIAIWVSYKIIFQMTDKSDSTSKK
jgi:TonB family protein